MEYEEAGRDALLRAHLRSLSTHLGSEGTLVVPTHTLNLCNTDILFDPETTPCTNGVFSEYVRTQPGTVRSFHPFISYGALGIEANAICENVSRHGYGPETPMSRMIEADTMSIHIGLHPEESSSIVHHVEMQMGVPYRYTKEFMHPVVREGKRIMEPFYLYVWYKQCEIKRDRNKKIFMHFLKNYSLNQVKVGRGYIFSYSMRDFYQSMVGYLREDIYGWLREIPATKPFRN
ncbi:MAG: AAC(3) family N-acetyltransferase [Deltaproteobacteria bacterium]|nr:AAC(3) family N-acetyltransferase [Deltaproteobacteria bacterium]